MRPFLYEKNLQKRWIPDKKLVALYSFILSVCFHSVCFAVVYNVKKDGTGNFTTIQACVNVADPGDVCYVFPGSYDEEIKLTKSGRAGAHITIKGGSLDAKVLRGIDVYNHDYIRIEGLSITTPPPTSNDSWGVRICGNFTQVIGNFFYDIQSIAIWGYHYGDHTQTGVQIAGNHIARCNMGIKIRGFNWVVENNRIERLIQVQSNPYRRDADYIRAFGSNHLIRKNHCFGTLESEIGQSHTDGIQTWGAYSKGKGLHNSIIEGNIFQNYHQGFLSRSDETGSSNLIFRNNIYDNRNWSKNEWNGWGIATSGSNTTIVNNLFIGHYNAAIAIHNDQNKNGVLGGVVKNNLLIRNREPISLHRTFEGRSTGIESGHNLIFNYYSQDRESLSSTDLIDKDPLVKNLLNLPGNDGVYRTADDGYVLERGSPAIDAGFPMGDLVGVDILGTSRPQNGQWDIGPFEYKEGAANNNSIPSAPAGLSVTGK